MLPWPEVSHVEIVRRAVSRHPPFDSKGGGYRDTLVWLRALELARAGGRIYLARRDKAFAGEPGQLTETPQDQTRELEGTIDLGADLKAWALDRAPSLPADETTDTMRLEEFPQSFFYPRSFEQFWVAPHEVGLPPQAEDVELTDVESVGPLEVGRSRRLLNGGTNVEFTTEVRMALEIETSGAIALASGWEVLVGTTPGHVLARLWVDTIVTFGLFFEAGHRDF